MHKIKQKISRIYENFNFKIPDFYEHNCIIIKRNTRESENLSRDNYMITMNRL